MISLKVGEGNPSGSLFSDINWTSEAKFIKVEVDITGNTNYTHIGTSELVSVPFAEYSNKADKAVYSDTAEIAMQLGSKNVYSTNADTLFVVKDHEGNPVFAVFPDGVKVIVDQTAKGNVGGFAVSGRNPGKADDVSIFTVTPDSTRIYVNNLAKGNVGGFAVSGRNPGKGLVEDILVVNSDSTRVYIDESAKGNVGGFAVSGRNPGKAGFNDYFNVSGVGSAGLDTINPSEPRMLWYPKSEAFLVGRVLIEHPDSVGLNSISTGYESKAIGDYSQALGYQSRAFGDYSSAIGYQAMANNTNAFAFGSYAKALGINSFAFGENAEAHSSESYSFGRGAKSYGYRSFAFGSSGVDSSGAATGVTQAKGDYSFAIGQGSITGIDLADCPPKPSKYIGTQEEYWKIYYSGEGAVAIGVGDSSLASYATTLGYYNTASYGSVALGYQNKSYGMRSAILGGYSNTINSSSSVIAGGHGHIIDAPYAAILGGIENKVYSGAAWGVIGGGYRNEVYGSTSTIVNGTYNVATGALSTVIGSGNNAYSWCETVIGRYNDYSTSGNSDEWINTDHLFVVGNGSADDNRSNAMLVLKNGNVGIGVNPGVYKLNVTGGNAYFSGNVSALSFTDRTPYPKDLETAYKAVLSMKRLPDGEYDENNKENQLDHSTLHPFVKSSDGEHRDLSATVSAQNEVIKDLVKQVEKLKTENDLLKEKLNEIIELLNKE
jgi:hypothetical protein